jgi:hypothetical protein
MSDKIIVTNGGRLLAKYQAAGVKKIETAIKSLVAADKKRGITTRLVRLDDATDMSKFSASAVTIWNGHRQNKAAVDAIFKSVEPEYLVILGANDVVPHQDLKNPVYSPNRDDDRFAWADLPYACESPYSQDPSLFIGPSRVVGRIPDLSGATDPSDLIGLLKVAAKYKQRPAKDYMKYFGLSAKEWEGSSRLSIENIFGDDTATLLSPSDGPNHTGSKLGALSHFINCHGGQASPEFQGQKGLNYPLSMTSAKIAAKIAEGTVAAVECCYGAELYDSVTLGLDSPICQNYLSQGAYGYFGSSTIAYGPADGNSAADLICQYFLLEVLGGASLGSAALTARQRFVEQTGQMDAIDLKTIAQFHLLGDPSIQPVELPVTHNPAAKAVKSASDANFARAERRAKMRSTGEFLLKTKPISARKEKAGKVSAAVKTTMTSIAKKAGIAKLTQDILCFKVKGKSGPAGGKGNDTPGRYLIAIEEVVGTPSNLATNVAVVAKEMNGRIVDYRVYHQK